ncbi:SulP family inorganic anion transporter [Tessaracoccus terricola]
MLRSVRELLPGANDYAELPRSWRVDVFAGVTVGIVALPLALAFGVSSGVGAAAGLVTAVVAGIVAAVFGGSHVQVSGPTGAMVVVLAPIVATHGVGSVALLSLMAGIIVFALGITKLGRAVAFIPWPVVEGFTLGIGVIIFLQQVPLALAAEGVEGLNAVVAAWLSVSGAELTGLGLALVLILLVVAVQLLVPRIHKALPASLVGVILATVVVEALGLDVPRIGALPQSLAPPSMPEVSVDLVTQLVGPAVAVALLAAIESLLSARVASGLRGPEGTTTGPYHPDRELVGQGLASVAAGLFGGMPATGAIARTAVNVRSGGRTRVSVVVHSLVLLLVVYVGSGLVSRIPIAALAGVLMVTAARMVFTSTAKVVLRSSRSSAALFTITAFVTVAFDLIEAIQIGVIAAAFFALRAVAKMSGATREQLPGKRLDGDSRIALFRLEGSMFFGASERIMTEISAVKGVEVVILRMSHLDLLDATGAHTLVETIDDLESRGVTVLIKGVRSVHTQLVERVGVVKALRHHKHQFDELEPAIEHARSHVCRNAEARARAAGQE